MSKNSDRTGPSRRTPVEPLERRLLMATFNVTNVNDSGAGSLRTAITGANANGSAVTDVIAFNIPGTTSVISPLTALPTVSTPTTIDGSTDPNYATTVTFGTYIPVIVLAGGNAGSLADGLAITGGCTVRALGIQNFGQNGIRVTGNSNAVYGCHLGVGGGTTDIGNGVAGVRLQSGSSNQIGGTGGGADRNVIGGNNADGIDLLSTGTNNFIDGNYVGTDYTGNAAVPNAGRGISVSGGGYRIGVNAGNVVSGNAYGIDVFSDNNIIAGNFIGVSANGVSDLGQTNSSGVILYGDNNTVGGTTQFARNVISGNSQYGVRLTNGAASNTVQGNYIGTNAGGSAAVANGLGGVSISAGSSNTVRNNDIGGNGGAGVAIGVVASMTSAPASNNNVVAGNRIGLRPDVGTALPNIGGVLVFGTANGNRIGGTVAADRNVISGNTGPGVVFQTSTTGANSVVGNYIGTNAAGTAAIPNANGVDIQAGSGATIGGTTAAARNVISGNNGIGVALTSGGTGHLVQGNYIGTNASGTAAVGNGGSGVYVQNASNNTVRGNLVSGNDDQGVYLRAVGTDVTNNNVVEGNLIGTNAAGTAAIANGLSGVDAGGTGNRIGGDTSAARNVISGNSLHGVRLTAATSASVRNNYLGTNAAGTADLGNGGNGILIFGGNANTVGGVLPAGGSYGNVISGNDTNGIEISGTSNNIISGGNLIGANAAGTAAVGNTGAGIRFNGNASTNNAIVLTNTIAFNGGDGIEVNAASTGNPLYGNSIYSNGGLGIDLLAPGDPAAGGVTPNDTGDADAGGNNRQNFPVLNAPVNNGMTTQIGGSLNAAPNTAYLITLYQSSAADPTGYGEGQTPISNFNATTDATGNVLFGFGGSPAIPVGSVITATATAPDGSTSEFSLARAVLQAGPPVFVSAFLAINGPSVTFTFDRPIDPASVQPGDLTITKLAAPFAAYGAGTASVLADGKTVAFTLPPNMLNGQYRFTIPANAIAGLNGSLLTTPTVYEDPNATYFLAGDADRNRVVDFNDFVIFQANIGTTPSLFTRGDFNRNGVINFDDFTILQSNFGLTV